LRGIFSLAAREVSMSVLNWVVGVVAVFAACVSVGCETEDGPPNRCPAGSVPLSDELLAELGEKPKTLACRPAASGEVLINEVTIRPAGRDLDGDGKSSGRDEVIEVVSLAREPVHLNGATLVYRGASRGTVVSSSCLAPATAAVLVGASTGDVKLPPGASLARLDKSLRLTDGGGHLALVGVAANVLDKVAVPMARTVTDSTVNRTVDGWREASLEPHATLSHANNRTWSPGYCADGEAFPVCVTEGVLDREAYFDEPTDKGR